MQCSRFKFEFYLNLDLFHMAASKASCLWVFNRGLSILKSSKKGHGNYNKMSCHSCSCCLATSRQGISNQEMDSSKSSPRDQAMRVKCLAQGHNCHVRQILMTVNGLIFQPWQLACLAEKASPSWRLHVVQVLAKISSCGLHNIPYFLGGKRAFSLEFSSFSYIYHHAQLVCLVHELCEDWKCKSEAGISIWEPKGHYL